MIANLQPYPAYKPSSVEWLGEVPEHWNVRRLWTVAEMRVSNVDKHANDDELPVRLCNYVDVYHNRRITPQMPFMRATASREEIKRFHLQPNDVLITKDSETWDDIAVPALVAGSSDDLICGYHLAMLRAREGLLGTYLAWVLQSEEVAHQFYVEAKGVTRFGLTHSGIQGVQIPLPPLPEQAAIVRCLDHVDQRIQRYIHAKDKLIALLEEEKQAIINQAVTRGLDPNVPLKPSGLDWLGDVPAHWQVRRLEQIGRFSKGNGGTKGDESTEGLPCVRYGDIYMHHKYFIESTRSRIPEERAQVYTPIQYGDLLFAGSGETIEEIGKSAVNLMEEEAYCGGDVILFRPTGHINPRFVGYASDCTQATFQKSTMGRGITVMHIYSSQLKYLALAFPPLAEQRAIVEHVDKATKGIEVAVIRSRRQIDLLEEYRTRLVSDVVTGKLDVREAAANLPGAPTPPLDPDGPAHGSSAPIADAVLHDVR